MNCVTISVLIAIWGFAVASAYFHGVANNLGLQDLNHDMKQLLQRQYYERMYEEKFHPVEQTEWPLDEYDFGQIAGVDVDKSGNPVIFHRGTTIWDSDSFNGSFHYQRIHEGPIEEDTLVVLDARTGQLMGSWGSNIFYMPHGLFIDYNNSIWITDVASHQVIKFLPGTETPMITVGKAFTPGGGKDHLCAPTDVTVSKSGVFFVSDGYCNSRIVKYDRNGNFLAQFGEDGTPWSFGNESLLALPHSIALVEEEDVLCIADRENRRILCICAGLKNPKMFGDIISVTNGRHVGKVFGIVEHGGKIYGINGPGSSPVLKHGVTVDWKTANVVDTWTSKRSFIAPHDIGISPDGKTLYISETGPNRLTKFEILPRVQNYLNF